MATLTTQKRWLRVTALVIGAAAPLFFLATMPGTAWPATLMIDLMGWPVDGGASLAAAEARLLSALTAGFLLGWAVTVWLLSGPVFDAAPEGVRQAVLVGTVAWFTLDSLGSVLSGHPVNVVFNIVILALAVGPLWRPAQS